MVSVVRVKNSDSKMTKIIHGGCVVDIVDSSHESLVRAKYSRLMDTGSVPAEIQANHCLRQEVILPPKYMAV